MLTSLLLVLSRMIFPLPHGTFPWLSLVVEGTEGLRAVLEAGVGCSGVGCSEALLEGGREEGWAEGWREAAKEVVVLKEAAVRAAAARKVGGREGAPGEATEVTMEEAIRAVVKAAVGRGGGALKEVALLGELVMARTEGREVMEVMEVPVGQAVAIQVEGLMEETAELTAVWWVGVKAVGGPILWKEGRRRRRPEREEIGILGARTVDAIERGEVWEDHSGWKEEQGPH
ncbi:MAG: hypothetical protein SGPRY_002462 [Prymnesium sp.]